jgi:hypothetical protein
MKGRRFSVTKNPDASHALGVTYGQRDRFDPRSYPRGLDPRHVPRAGRWQGQAMLRARAMLRASRPVVFTPPHPMPYPTAEG